MALPEDRWLDQEAGPVVRPYALIGGRTRPAGEALDVIAMIIAVRGSSYDPADLAADLDLPLGVVQILLSDLRERSLITVHHPIPPARLPDPQILKEVVDGLRRL
jgi:Protein of unknown function (DUF742)